MSVTNHELSLAPNVADNTLANDTHYDAYIH